MSTTSTQSVTAGTWITQSINGMQYKVLLPANYDPSVAYPTVLYLHQLDMGNDPSGLLDEVNPWFNSTSFRTDHPAIIVMPLLDQSQDPSGETINWGGISTADSAGETNALAALQQVESQYKVDTSRVYVTGNSMGGIGTEDMLIKYNAYTGTEGKIFAAGLSLAGADYGQGYPQPSQAIVNALKNVPFWAIHGGQDTQVPLQWDQNLYAAEQAAGGDMIYTQNDSLGHDVWDTYYPQTGSGSPLSWLFDQSSKGTVPPTATPTPTPKPTPSANDTTVKAGSTAAITDAAGNTWTITTGAQVAVNGAADTTTARVTELAYVGGKIYQENADNLWWSETSPTSGWVGGTATSPLPATPTTTPTPTKTPTPTPTGTPKPTPSANDTVVKAGTSAAITDAAGNKWTITAGAQVAVNGTTDTTTARVTELAYVGGKIYQENADNLWWSETSPTSGWVGGTSTSPLPAGVPTSTPTSTPSTTPHPTPNPTSAGTRDPSQIPFASTSIFNLPIGSNAVWTPNQQLASANLFVNTTMSGYNENIYTATASDPLVTVTNTAGEGGEAGVFQVHIPSGAIPAGGGDRTFSVDDTTSHTWYSFGGFHGRATTRPPSTRAPANPITAPASRSTIPTGMRVSAHCGKATCRPV
jgi:predicted esterase